MTPLSIRYQYKRQIRIWNTSAISGLDLLSLHFPALIDIKAVFASMPVINYFPFYSLYPIDETSQATHFSNKVSSVNILRSLILYVVNFTSCYMHWNESFLFTSNSKVLGKFAVNLFCSRKTRLKNFRRRKLFRIGFLQ